MTTGKVWEKKKMHPDLLSISFLDSKTVAPLTWTGWNSGISADDSCPNKRTWGG